MAYRAINPYNGQLIREYPVATEDEIEETLRNADDFYHDAKNQSVLEREKILKQLVDELAGHADYYAKILTNNMGKLSLKQNKKLIKL
jgi:NAD-dependent aldehyde dehydrogenases